MRCDLLFKMHGRYGARVELLGFHDAGLQDFLILPLHHAGDAEEIDDPPDDADEAAAEDPEKDILHRMSEVEIVHAEDHPEDVSGRYFLLAVRIQGQGIVFLLLGEQI